MNADMDRVEVLEEMVGSDVVGWEHAALVLDGEGGEEIPDRWFLICAWDRDGGKESHVHGAERGGILEVSGDRLDPELVAMLRRLLDS